MATIYELDLQQQELLAALEMEDIDTNVSKIMEQLSIVNASAEYKIKAITNVMLELEAEHEARKEVIAGLTKKNKAAQNNIDRIREYILYAMQTFDIDKVKTQYKTVYKQRGAASVVVGEEFNIERLPSSLVRYIPAKKELDKNATTIFLKELAGGEITKHNEWFDNDLQLGLVKKEMVGVK